ncbi:MAG: carboxylesterase/lipase family protein [Lachnospiraceae bacterium]|nr:carboxylesterase/lipase family protein [Lachnospiraceae bacterium]
MSLGIVNTTYGSAKGIQISVRDGNIVTEFRGIAYAAPPVGNLRWKPPVAPESWEGVRTFDQYAPIEVQFQDGHGAEIINKLPMSEDCLYLNVTTPAERAGEKLPVLVWFHGGGLTNGTPYGDGIVEPYDFAARGNVVVTVAHRINIWGFMALPQLTKEQGTSGNYGLMDLAAALDWIWDNIEVFGGDRENITAGGESGGTQKTCAMATLPAGKHRIRRIYNSSGLKWRQVPFLTQEEGEKAGIEYLKHVGIDPDLSLEELRALDTDTIHKNVSREYYPGEIIYDGKFVTEPSFGDLFDKYLENVDFINVTGEGETNVFAHRGASGVRGSFFGELPVRDYSTLKEFFKERLGELYDKYDFDKYVQCEDKDAVFTARLLGSIGISERASNNHSRNNMVNRLFGEYLKKKCPDNRTYSLLWCHIPPTEDESGASDRDHDPAHRLADHCTDGQYIFNTLDKHENVQWTETDRCYAEIMGAYLSNFMKNGDINGEGLPYIGETGDHFAYARIGDRKQRDGQSDRQRDGQNNVQNNGQEERNNIKVENLVTMCDGLSGPLEEMACEYVRAEYGIE